MTTNSFFYILFWVCVAGLCLGSFFNVVIIRSLSGENIVFPPSKCPKCGKKLKPWHNIPVLSYIFLRGKCAFCGEKISIQYPLVEIITMLLFAACYIRFGFDLKTLFAMILCSTLIIMSGTDIKERVVDCNIAIGLGILGLIYNCFAGGDIIGSVLGLVCAVVIVEGIALICKFIFGVRGFGEADAYVAGALGACFGLKGILITLGYTLVASMLFIIPMFLYKQYMKGNKTTCILFILFILTALVFRTLTQDYVTMGLYAAPRTAFPSTLPVSVFGIYLY